jgi:hypothetical protein
MRRATVIVGIVSSQQERENRGFAASGLDPMIETIVVLA